MRPITRWSSLFVTLGVALAACSGDPAPAPDAAAPADVATADVATADVASDASGDAAPDRAAVDRPAPTCDGEDLTGMDPGADGTVRVRSDNRDSELNRFGAFASGCFSGGAVGALKVYQYTMRAAGALRVSTANPGTATSFDTFVAVLGSCISSGRSIACNDNASGTVRQSTTTTAALAAGQRVFIVVGGRGMAAASVARGSFELSLREIAEGGLDGPCRTSGEACDSGLLCTALFPSTEATGVCRRPVAAGMPCVAGTLCARGATCIANAGNAAMGTCVADGMSGGVCLVGRAPCAAGLTCTVAIPAPDNTGLCRPTLAAGAECDTTLNLGVCGPGLTCRQAPTATNPGRYQCFAVGGRGGACRAGSPQCDPGLECSTATPPSCRASVMRGAACDPTGNADFCESGFACAPDAMFAGGTCAALGAAGTPCRMAEPACDMGLTCGAVGGRNLCRREVAADAACDWRYGSAFCPTGVACLAAGPSRGVCAAPTMETEPNNSPAGAQGPVTQSAIFRGSITAGSDTIDCYRARVPAGASLFIESNDNMGGCHMGDPIVGVLNASGAVIAENDDISSTVLCSRLDGRASGPLHAMAAGDYAVCIRSFNAAQGIPQYFLTVAIIGATN
jgi:hypothetical protein